MKTVQITFTGARDDQEYRVDYVLTKETVEQETPELLGKMVKDAVKELWGENDKL